MAAKSEATDQKPLLGRLSIQDVLDHDTSDEYIRSGFLQCQVYAVSGLATYTKKDSTTSSVFQATLIDSTGCLSAKVYDDNVYGMAKKSTEENPRGAVLVSNFLVKNKTVIITRGSTFMVASPLKTPPTDEILQQAAAMHKGKKKTEALPIKAIHLSPKKTRVSARGKIVKIGPLLNRTIKSTSEVVDLRNISIRDKTGTISVGLWRDDASLDYKKGDLVEITNAEVNEWDGKKSINTREKKCINFLNSCDDLDGVPSEDEEGDPDACIGEVIAFSRMTTYSACGRKSCNLKKLQDFKCPNCGSIYSEETAGFGISANVAIINENSMVDAKIFKTDICKLFAAKFPGTSIGTCVNSIETNFRQLLPMKISYTLTPTKIITNLKIM